MSLHHTLPPSAESLRTGPPRTRPCRLCSCWSAWQEEASPGEPVLTVIFVGDNRHPSPGELSSDSPAHGHAQKDPEGLLLFIQGVINDHDPARFLTLVLVKADDTGVVLGPRDVIGVGQHRGGHGATRGAWTQREGDGVLRRPGHKAVSRVNIHMQRCDGQLLSVNTPGLCPLLLAWPHGSTSPWSQT